MDKKLYLSPAKASSNENQSTEIEIWNKISSEKRKTTSIKTPNLTISVEDS